MRLIEKHHRERSKTRRGKNTEEQQKEDETGH